MKRDIQTSVAMFSCCIFLENDLQLSKAIYTRSIVTSAVTFPAYLCNKKVLQIFTELMLNWETEDIHLVRIEWQLDYSDMVITVKNNHVFSALYPPSSLQIFIKMFPKQWTRENHSDLPTFNLPVTSPFELRAFTVTLWVDWRSRDESWSIKEKKNRFSRIIRNVNN